MKNQIQRTIAIVSMMIALLTISGQMKAQACLQDWGIENNTPCRAFANIKFYCNGVNCGSVTGVQIPAYTTVWTQWPSGCTAPCSTCDVAVTITDLMSPCPGMGGPTVSSGNQTAAYNCSSCPDNAATSTVYWVGAQNLVMIGQ